MSDEKLNLSRIFPSVSTKVWKEKIISDLKGADYDKKLVWHAPEGIDVQPFYRLEDIKNSTITHGLPGQFPFVRGTKTNNDWAIRQNVCACNNVRKANEKAKELITKGITSLNFCLDAEKLKYDVIKKLLDGINPNQTILNFNICIDKAPELTSILTRYFRRMKYDIKQIKGSVNIDPMRNMLLHGKKIDKSTIQTVLSQAIKNSSSLPQFRVIGVNSIVLSNAGFYCIDELVYALAWGVEYLSLLTDKGISAATVASNIHFDMGISGNYFMEIAKFRAARLLWAKIVEAYKNPIFTSALKNASRMYVSATTSIFNTTLYDDYVNLLRTQTETMSASLAGVNEITTLPYDIAYEQPTEFAERIARNQQLLLKDEAHFDKVTDPAAGSYYIEKLTEMISQKAWNKFLDIQEKGGLLAMIYKGDLQKEAQENLDKRMDNIAKRKEILLGTNQYPNFNEISYKKIKNDECCKGKPCCKPETNSEIVTLPHLRGAQDFENIRLQTEQAKKKPIVFMLTIGNLSMRIARAQFSCNFFACAGYKVIDNNGFKTIKEGIKAAKKAKADIIVLCSSDEEYATLAPQAWEELKTSKEILVIAGAPACMEDLQKIGIKNFIHVRSNVLNTLRDFNNQLLEI